MGIILTNQQRQLFWARRIGQNAWQFPQGGIKTDETPEQAMFRELLEEVGLRRDQVRQIGATQRWLRYRLPKRYLRRDSQPLCIGQKQIWFMLKLCCEESAFCLDRTDHPEFEDWRWVGYWQPIREVIYFKRRVYALALRELAPLLFPDGCPEREPRHHPFCRHR